MSDKIICNKISSLLSAYIDEKLDENMTNMVKEHLKGCTECCKKYINLKKLLKTLQKEYSLSNEKAPIFKIEEYEKYLQNLSSYCDNEMSFDESVNFKKYIIKIPTARQELKKMYKLRELLQKSKQNIEKKFNHDFSDIITDKIYSKRKDILLFRPYKLTASILALFFIVLACSFIVINSIHNHQIVIMEQKLSKKVSHFSKKIENHFIFSNSKNQDEALQKTE